MRPWVLASAVLFAAPAEAQALGAGEDWRASIPEARRVTVSVPHGFPVEQALERVSHLFQYWKERFHVVATWHGRQALLSGLVFGFRFNAVFSVDDDAIVAVADDPGWPWRSRATGYVERKLKKYLHPAYVEP